MCRLIIMILVFFMLLSACCPRCREQQVVLPSPDLSEIPEPFRLQHQHWPTQYLQDFVVIQGGSEFVLTPEYPGWGGGQ